eukprot:206583-Chlamydomonas_euryale.AAC.1
MRLGFAGIDSDVRGAVGRDLAKAEAWNGPGVARRSVGTVGGRRQSQACQWPAGSSFLKGGKESWRERCKGDTLQQRRLGIDLEGAGAEPLFWREGDEGA